MKHKDENNRDGIPPLPARAGGQDWIEERQAAHLAAFQEVRRMNPRELAALLKEAAADAGDRAGDLTCHDEAMPDLMREAACFFAAEIVRKKGGSK